MAKLNVPETFGNIKNDPHSDPFNPWIAQEFVGEDYDGNPLYEDIGRFESFGDSLLALIIANNAYREEQYEESNNKIKKLVKNTRKKIKSKRIDFDDDYEDIDMEFNQANMMYQRVRNFAGTMGGTYLNPALDYSNPLMKLTFKEVYERWYKDKCTEDITQHTLEGYKATYKKVQHLADKVFVEIKFSEIEDCVRQEKLRGNSFSMRKRVKLFFSQLYQWGISHEICTNNMALNIKLGKNESDWHRKPFSLTQVATLFHHVDEDPFIEEVLMLIFCGCRINEFLNIKREDIHMGERYFIVTESKTKAGRNRIVPINKKMVKYFRKRLRARSDYLIHDVRGRKVDAEDWRRKFKNLMKRFEWSDLSPHCCRHTLATMLHSAGADPISTKRILGHTPGATVTERVYIHIQLQDLHAAMDLI